MRLRSRLSSVSKEAALKVKVAESTLSRIKPDRVLDLLELKLLAFEKRLSDAARRDKRDRVNKLEALNSRLEALSPQSVLNRGFSVLYSKGIHIRSVFDVKNGDSLEARVADGVITGIVRKEIANG